MLGIGYTDILDTYLSPEKYRGTDLRFLSHTRREKDSTCLVHQLLHEGCIATADNRWRCKQPRTIRSWPPSSKSARTPR
jgi:hypothetical protein